ncbi:VCBS repeat-containing protein [Pelagicoccus sp. SDUM812003]|uniref:FG-GAP repeat domain-containing protein n=1 Tax=Pelagicoccus sp. SDUM812003 TaxID=3041267 RepID=UPI00280F1A75|nr:VCBS repeat-containing protein [Pelagicoccus sp. SDUM812003]MDQ8203512.1 VCBS repeat-containing protein [Pelagicoccus sp. SDUM812003]
MKYQLFKISLGVIAGALCLNSVSAGSDSLQPLAVGMEAKGEPWVSNVRIADLNQDGLPDILACEGRLNQVSWLRQESPGVFEESIIAELAPGPVFTEIVDLNDDGLMDVLVACMGIVIPNNGRIGSVLLLENQGDGTFEQSTLLQDVPRVTYVTWGDLNGDGLKDLVVGAFGFFDGEIRWMENLGNNTFKSHPLLDLSGTIHAPVCDVDGDGDLDIVALVSQDWEEIHVFENDGAGNFEGRVAYGALNKDFGSSGLCVADVDDDGSIDIVYTNGDGLDYSTPGPRSWHGLQWLRNDGTGQFEYRRIADLPGAHSPLVVDYDGDGRKDIVVVSAYNDWSSPDAVSLVCYLQMANKEFEKTVLAHEPTHLISVDGADMDGDGQVEFVTGAFMYYPPFDNISRVTYWDRPLSSKNR